MTYNIQPSDHISTFVPSYSWQFRISGAAYSGDPTNVFNFLEFFATPANPKSINFTFPRLSTIIFSGFMSLNKQNIPMNNIFSVAISDNINNSFKIIFCQILR
eukprot:NODE_105_length_19280_cov_0.929461.p16 type:complete len:103 gc:universal NODE_105_length_19280_cov_0.929461:18021-17713(-)